MAIDRTGLNEEEINLIEHCVTLEEQGLIDSDGSVVSGKETEFGFDNPVSYTHLTLPTKRIV